MFQRAGPRDKFALGLAAAPGLAALRMKGRSTQVIVA